MDNEAWPAFSPRVRVNCARASYSRLQRRTRARRKTRIQRRARNEANIIIPGAVNYSSLVQRFNFKLSYSLALARFAPAAHQLKGKKRLGLLATVLMILLLLPSLLFSALRSTLLFSSALRVRPLRAAVFPRLNAQRF